MLSIAASDIGNSGDVVARGWGAGYLFVMALTAYCPNCRRTVYVDEKDTPVCPVCSTPLLEVVAEEDQREGKDR
jgi:uncharacterized protein YbaR (Trm112 family)